MAEKQWVEKEFPVKGEITLETLSNKHMAYVRHTGTYESLAKEYASLLERLLDFAKDHHIVLDQDNWILSMYHDNPEFGEQSQFRTSICITLPENFQFEEDGIIGKMDLEGGLYAVGHFEIYENQFGGAWDYMYEQWLTQSGYMPRNYNPFEVYKTSPEEIMDGIQQVNIYVPIEPIDF